MTKIVVLQLPQNKTLLSFAPITFIIIAKICSSANKIKNSWILYQHLSCRCKIFWGHCQKCNNWLKMTTFDAFGDLIARCRGRNGLCCLGKVRGVNDVINYDQIEPSLWSETMSSFLGQFLHFLYVNWNVTEYLKKCLEFPKSKS